MSLRSRLLAGAVAVAAFTTSAAAQEGIEVVTVTAAKREQNIQDVPISMEVLGAEKVNAFNYTTLNGIETKIPGLSIQLDNGGNRVALRGFGSSSNPAYDQTVAVYRDGIFQGKSRQSQMPFLDVQRIEVLRGPQGALVGKNSAAGAISIISNLPTDTFEGKVTASYLVDEGGFDTFGYLSGPLTDELSGRVAFKFRNAQGILKNFALNREETAEDVKSGRVTLRFKPDESFEDVLKFEINSAKYTGHNFFGLPATASSTWVADWATIKAAGGYSAIGLGGLGPDNKGPLVPSIGLSVPTVSDFDKYNSYDFANTATWDLGGVTLVSITGYSAYSSRYLAGGRHAAVETVMTDFIENFKQGSQEFRLLSPTGQTFEWIAGFYADISTQNLRNVYHMAVPGTRDAMMYTEFKQDAITYSGYATGTWNVTDDLRAIIGVRGTAITKTGRFQLFQGGLIFGTYFNTAVGPYAGSFTDSTFDPSATIQYDLTDDVMVYANYSKGSKAGTYQGTSRVVTPLDWRLKQEVSTSYEVGVKSKFWDWLLVNVSAYYMEMKNFQVQQFIQLAGEPFPSNRAANAAKVRAQGVEMTLNADLGQWIEGLRYELSGAYTDSIFDDYPGAPCTVPVLPPLGNCVAATGTVGAGGPLYNAGGLPLQLNSVWKGTTSLSYTRPVFDDLKLDLYVGLDMRSKYYFDTSSYDPNIGLQRGIAALDVRVAIGDVDDGWSIAFLGQNLNDTYRASQRYTFPGNPGTVNVYGVVGGRKLSIQATLKF